MSGVRSTNSKHFVSQRATTKSLLAMCFVLACYWVSSRHDPCRVRSNLLPSKSANFGRLLRFFTCYLLRLSESSRSVDLHSAAAASRVLRLGECVEGAPRRARQGVELTGIEPVASGLQSPRSPS